MASLRKKSASTHWFACFTLPDGRRVQRSTGSDDRRIAQRIANEFEDAACAGRTRRFTEVQARKTIADIFAIANAESLPSSTIRDFLDSWLKRKSIENDERTHERYAGAIKHVLDRLGSKADHDIAHLGSRAIVSIRDDLAAKLSPNSANFTVKVLRAALNQARRDGLVDVNEASRVTLIREGQKLERRPFTMDELRRILAVANEEWRGMVLVGLYAGLRLGDVAALTWQNLDLSNGQLTLVTQKTGRRVVLPLASPLLRHLEALPAGDDPEAPLFPEAHALKTRNPHGGPLSNQFYSILVAAGLMPPRTHKATGKGRDTKRQLNALSFHALRHTATSLLKNAGVSDVVARDLIGHESVAVSAHYTHVDDAAKRAAVAKLPDVLVDKPQDQA